MCQRTSSHQSSPNPKEMRMVRTFHPVGHGAFYTEQFMQDDKVKLSVVFDCGCYEAGKSKMSSQKYIERIEKEITTFYKHKGRIDLLFISHFHTDHINGIKKLCEYCDVKHIIVPQLTPEVVIEAYVFNYIQNFSPEDDTTSNLSVNEWINSLYTHRNNQHIQEEFPIVVQVEPSNMGSDKNHENIEIDKIKSPLRSHQSIVYKIACKKSWLYIPFNLPYSEEKKQLLKLSIFSPAIGKDETIDFDELDQILKKDIDAVKKEYEKVFGDKHNSYSMTVFSGVNDNECVPSCFIKDTKYILVPHGKYCGVSSIYCTLNCLYCGDFEANPNYPEKNMNCEQLLNYYKQYWDRIGLLQVPHHGSEHNLNTKLYTHNKICIISASENDKYKHPDKSVLLSILRECSIPIIVTENDNSKQEFTYNLFESASDTNCISCILLDNDYYNY